MPEICRFYGIVIAIFYNEHNPPHFHAKYGSDKVSIAIEGLTILDGSLPPRAMGLVIEWATLHRKELLNAWQQAKDNQQPNKIEPLS